MKKQLKTTWFDVYLGKYKWYRKLIGGIAGNVFGLGEVAEKTHLNFKFKTND